MLTKTFLALFIIIIIAFVGLGAFYLYSNQPKTALTDSSLSKGTITSEPASLTLELGSPDNDTLSSEPNIVISGKTSPDTQVLIQSETHDIAIQAKKDGSFSTIFDLTEGVNNIQVTVFDKNGDERSTLRTVYYTKDKI